MRSRTGERRRTSARAIARRQRASAKSVGHVMFTSASNDGARLTPVQATKLAKVLGLRGSAVKQAAREYRRLKATRPRRSR